MVIGTDIGGKGTGKGNTDMGGSSSSNNIGTDIGGEGNTDTGSSSSTSDWRVQSGRGFGPPGYGGKGKGRQQPYWCNRRCPPKGN